MPNNNVIVIPQPSASPVDAAVVAQKYAQGATLPGGRFDFGLFDDLGNLISSATANASGMIRFPAMSMTEPGVTHYTVRELSHSGGGWITDVTVFPVTITTSDYGGGQLTANIDYPNGTPIFTNTYDTPASDHITAYKSVEGWTGAEPTFNFGLYNLSGTLLGSATNSDGIVHFPDITYTQAGTYNYIVKETTQSSGNWTNDTSEYPVTVIVTSSENGQLIAEVTYPEGQPTFNNVYRGNPAPVDVAFTGTKNVTGAAMTAGQFTFGVYDAHGDLIGTTTNNANGTIRFPAMTITEAGVEHFTVKELTPSGNGWTTDRTEFPVTVTASDYGGGQLTANIDYPNGTPIFTNTYSAPTPVTAVVTAHKTAVGAALPAGAFQFALRDSGGRVVATATNNADGTVTFPPQSFAEAGTYSYTVTESTRSGNGWTTDARTYPATVIVTAGLSPNQLVARVDYPNGTPRFTNTYTSPPETPVTVCVKACKKVHGAPLCANMFTFGLYGSDGKELGRALNDDCGNIAFELTVSRVGIYTYTLRELNGSGCGWEMDERSFRVTVTATNDAQGQLTASVAYPDGTPSFVNKYCGC